MRLPVLAVLCSLLLVICGCSPRVETDQERLARLVPGASATTKVTGKVMVDGVPGKDVWVTLHPAQGGSAIQLPKAQVREDGSFQVTTYLEGDGAPPGDYNITLESLTFRQIGAQWVGPDKLKNLYNNPKSTPYHVSVKETPVELPPFELKVSGVEAKPAPDPEPVAGRPDRKATPFNISLDHKK
jgi:hypothetical protein